MSNNFFFLGNEGYKEGQGADATEVRAATGCVHYKGSGGPQAGRRVPYC